MIASAIVLVCAWNCRDAVAQIALPKPPDDFEIKLFAAPPEVNYPTCIAAAPTGELYVGVDKQGSLGRKPGEGKIVRCVDSDGNGKADKFTTFAKADHPRGLVYDHGMLWVLHPPTLSVFHDDDRDGVADRSEVLLKDISTDKVQSRGADHCTNGIRMGIDGWIYIAVGDFGFLDATGKDGRKVTLRGGGVARVRPDGTELEVYAYGLRNIVDVAIDPRMNLFVRDNTNDGGGWDTRLMHVVPTAHFGYPSLFKNFDDEVLRPLADYGGGSGCGAFYVNEPWLPKPYHDALLTCDWGRDRVFYHPLPRDAATFAAGQAVFLAIPRPTDIDVDGHGNLYVSSWHNGMFDYRGENVGYIVQLRPKNNSAPALPDITKLGDDLLVVELRSASHVRRLAAQREILRRGAKPMFSEPLIDLMRTGETVDSRIAAIYTYKQLLGVKATPELVSLTSDANVREHVLRALTDRTTQLDGVSPQPFVTALRDADPRVQVAAIVGLARLGHAAAAQDILPLTAPATAAVASPPSKQAIADPQRVVPHVACRALATLHAADACLAALDGPYREGGLRALRLMHDPRVVRGLIARLDKTADTQQRLALMGVLIRLYHREADYKGSWWGTRPDTTGPYFERAKWEETPRIEAALRMQLAAADAPTVESVQKELKRLRVTIQGLPAAIARESQQPQPENRASPVTIPQVDPKNPRQIGNLPIDKVLAGATAAKGTASQGAELFKRQNCIACHVVAPGQTPVGPQLADIGKRYNRRQLAESVVTPNAAIAQGFATTLFDLKSGLTVSGFVVREAAEEVEVRTSEGISKVVLKPEIEERRESKLSAMPEGLVGNLTVEELASLLAYLESLSSKP